MNNPEVRKVPFMGDELIAFRDNDGQIWGGIRWMCDGIGMTEGQRKRQIRNIQEDRVLSKGGSNLVLPTKSGNQDVFCLKIDYIPLWLAKIKITPTMETETPELADKLEAYQLKAKDALANAFSAQGQIPRVSNPEVPLGALVRLLEFQERNMKERGYTPYEIASMATGTMNAYGVVVTKAFTKEVDPQLCLFDAPALPSDAPLMLV